MTGLETIGTPGCRWVGGLGASCYGVNLKKITIHNIICANPSLHQDASIQIVYGNEFNDTNTTKGLQNYFKTYKVNKPKHNFSCIQIVAFLPKL